LGRTETETETDWFHSQIKIGYFTFHQRKNLSFPITELLCLGADKLHVVASDALGHQFLVNNAFASRSIQKFVNVN